MLAVELERSVAEEIAWDPSVDARDLCVRASAGKVTLMGRVQTLAQKRAAENAAHRVSGVGGVVNQLQVAVRSLDRDEDDDIASMAYLSLRWDADVPDDVKAYVRDACVTLTGTVESQCQREAAEEAVARLRGIRGVENRIVVRPVRLALGVRAAIQAALRRNVELADREFIVDVRGDTVVLTGLAKTWAQSQAAARAAWSARGVAHVENRIAVG